MNCQLAFTTTHSELCSGGQDISSAEEEATKRDVQAKAARKAEEKAGSDAAKSAKQLVGIAEELAAKEAEFKVGQHGNIQFGAVSIAGCRLLI